MSERGAKIIAGCISGFVTAIVVAFGATVGGTLLWLIWPLAVPEAFPGLVETGAVAARLSWRASVALTWVCALLIKASQTNNKA